MAFNEKGEIIRKSGSQRRTKKNKAPRPLQSVEVFRDRLRGGGEGPEMVVLPTGRFRIGEMGFTLPEQTVTISRPIAMSQYAVTFEEYDQFVDKPGLLQILFRGKPKRPHDPGWGRGRRPVINVSQEDARSYAKWLSVQTGRRYRLPSQVEWEYAARAGTETAYSWGDEIGVNRANCRGSGSEWSGRQTSPVGSFAPNGFGLYDMHGNVWEWVEYCWWNGYAMVRGGAWDDRPWQLRASKSNGYWPSDHRNTVGFRLVQDLNP